MSRPSPRISTESTAIPIPHHVLAGRVLLERGVFADYRSLERFHYAPGKPACPAGVWRAVYEDPGSGICDRAPRPRQENNPHVFSDPESAHPNLRTRRLIAVAVLAYPTPASHARERALKLTGPRYGPKLAFVNAQVRTIARVIVHPQFRGLGVAAALVRRICDECPTRYVEAFAAMGDAHPLFDRAGMTRVTPAGNAIDGGPAYFIFDREGGRHAK